MMNKPKYYLLIVAMVAIAIIILINFLNGRTAELPLIQTVETEKYQIKVEKLAGGLEHPWSLAFLPEGGMLVTERPGRMLHVSRSGELSRPIDGLPRIYDKGQGGLLDVILDPDYSNNRKIYFSYAEPDESGSKGSTAVATARLDLNDLSLSDLKVIFRQEPKLSGGRHFGCRLVMSRDNKLFIALGERGRMEQAQQTDNHLGTLVRINPDGTVPADNPFVNNNKVLPEIYSYGHRNIQGAELHPRTGELWLHEHGARGGDEINIPEPGRNYGWPVMGYGTHYSGAQIGVGTEKEGMEQPVYYWDPSIAPSGMTFYTGDYFKKWQGDLFVGALVMRKLVRLQLEDTQVTAQEDLLQSLNRRIRDIRQGPDDRLYLLTDHQDGEILRLSR